MPLGKIIDMLSRVESPSSLLCGFELGNLSGEALIPRICDL